MRRIGAISALFFLSTVAIAGTKTNTAVVIDDNIRYASGSLSSARTSSAPLEFLYCELYSSGSMQCRARDAAGTLRACSTSDPAHVKTIQMINSASYVSFWWDAAGNCTSILVRNGSNYLP